MIMIHAHKCDRRNFCLFLGIGGDRYLCSMADSGWLLAINRSTTGCVGLIAPLQIVQPCGFRNIVHCRLSMSARGKLHIVRITKPVRDIVIVTHSCS